MFRARFIAVALVLAALVPSYGSAAPLEKPIAGGYFFTQTAGRDGNVGFRVTDEGGVRFWSEFQRLGGVGGLGYPISRRFQKDGFTVQAMQKGVLQWRPDAGQAWITNVFDEMNGAGKDEWLESARSTPRPLPGSFDAGKDWATVVSTRQALLDASPAMRARYFAAADPMTFFGLPTSKVEDKGNHHAIRLQRATIQQWKVDVPWAKAGEVTVANGADIAKEAGLFPGDALRGESAEGQAAAAVAAPVSAPSKPASAPQPAPVAAAAASDAQAAVDRLNHYRTQMGLPPVKVDPALTTAANNHARYYSLNFGDPSLSGMGLHNETAGRPGFTGASWNDRARAAGFGGTVDENVGLAASPVRVIDAFVDTVNHRWNMLHPSAVSIGYGIDRAHPIDVIDVGFDRNAGDISKPAVYPGPNQQGVPTSSHIWETPDPAPGYPRPLGYPITATFPLRASVTFDAPQLFDGAGQPVEIGSSSKSWLRGQSIIPKRPLKPGTTYRAVVKGTLQGKPFEYAWSFTTAG